MLGFSLFVSVLNHRKVKLFAGEQQATEFSGCGVCGTRPFGQAEHEPGYLAGNEPEAGTLARGERLTIKTRVLWMKVG